MSIDNGTCHLCFPLQGETPPGVSVVLRDVDIVGVGSLRRRQVEQLRKTNEILLETHEGVIPSAVFSIYQVELLQTLHWLRPLKVESGTGLNFREEQIRLFQRLFPLTTNALGLAAEKIRDAYLEEMDWNSWLLQDHWRYFVGFLRQKFPDQRELLELAHWEWVQAWIEIQPFTSSMSEPGILSVNASLQTVFLTQRNSPLDREPGMYAFVFHEIRGGIVERPLDVFDAKLLDLLQQDRKYSADQLVSEAILSEDLPRALDSQEWKDKLASLCEAAFIEEGSVSSSSVSSTNL